MNTLPKINATIPKDHADILLLIKNTDADSTLRQSMGSTPEYSYEGHYLRVSYLRHWGKDSIEGLKNSFAKTNAMTSEYQFELIDINDRYWEASFTFLAHKKN
jgi:hypothetical protein